MGRPRPGDSLGLSGPEDRPRGVEMTQLMHGFPPSADTQVTLANWRQAPFSRWAFHHVRELVPSAEIANNPADVHEWPIDHVELGDIPIAAGGVRPLSFDEFLADTSTDGIVVVSGGRIVFEGTPADLVAARSTLTGEHLAAYVGA